MNLNLCAIGRKSVIVSRNPILMDRNHAIATNPLLSDKSFALIDFSDVHPLSSEGFAKYMMPLLPTHAESNHDTPFTPPRGILKSLFVEASSIQDVSLFCVIKRIHNSNKFNKPSRIKPCHKMLTEIPDMWDDDDAPIDA